MASWSLFLVGLFREPLASLLQTKMFRMSDSDELVGCARPRGGQ